MADLINGCEIRQPTYSDNSMIQDKCCDPVAIIGMGCRWPGDSTQPSELWEFLKAKKDAYSVFPANRINVDGFYHEKKGRPGSFYTRGGCFLKSDPKNFDHTFFGINPLEAMSIDPAQRKLLETVYEAFESAGVPLEKISGSSTGCFVGNFNYDHQLMQYRDTEYSGSYSVTGGGLTILSNRINYVFNLKGPSMTLDTACSSSMYALHLACSAIQTGDCSGAIVAGSNLILTPECQLFSSKLGAVSPTSRCHTFDAAADGYARADGIAAFYIKRLSSALQDRDPIRAIIRGTAVNANGKTGGITHPSPDGQEAVIRQAYERAGMLDPAMTGYFECHGTGTAVGDPLEMAAIARVFAPDRTKSNPLYVGSIKTNMGHSEPVSGLAGMMKAILALEHSIIPPTIGVVNLNPNIDLRDDRISIVTESLPWPKLPVRRVSVNSFGYGGANAHAILEAVDSFIPDYKSLKASAKKENPVGSHINGWDGYTNNEISANFPNIRHRRDQFLLVFSAHNEPTLRSNIAAIRGVCENYELIDLAYTLGVRRSHFSNRSFVVATRGNVKNQLVHESIIPYRSQSSLSPRLGFVFTGQGAQWPQMAHDLMSTFPSYLGTVRNLDGFLHDLEEPPTWTLEEILRRSDSIHDINKAELSQPATTAIQIALVNLLMSWNIKPVVAVGHSSGEIGAAYAAGLITARYAIVIAYLRGKAVAQNRKNGSMLAVGMNEVAYKSDFKDEFKNVVVACHNSPESITLSGDADDIIAVKAILEAKKIFTRILKTGGNAYHSPQMKLPGSVYEKEMIQTRLESWAQIPECPEISFFSSVNGRLCTRGGLGIKYWRSNLESPVLFKEAIEELVNTSTVDILIEIGPHSALRSPLQQIAKSILHTNIPDYIPTLIRGNDGIKNVLETAGILFAEGYPVNLERVNGIEVVEPKTCRFMSLENGSTIIDLPRYQWQYGDTLFLENRWTREWRLRQHPRHDLLGSRIPGGAKNDPTWRNMLRPKDLPWLRDHRLGSQIVFPAAAYLSMALEAVTQSIEIQGTDPRSIKSYSLRDAILHRALIVPDDNQGVELLLALHQVSLSNSSYHKFLYTFVVTSVATSSDDEHFIEHARGSVGINFEDSGKSKKTNYDLDESNPDGLLSAVLGPDLRIPLSTSAAKKDVSTPRWYKSFARTGLNYGPAFQGLSNIKAHGNSHVAEARIQMAPAASPDFGESRYVIHPAALDAAIQLAIVASHSGIATRLMRRFLPVSFEHINVRPSLQEDSGRSALSVAQGRLSGVRGLYSDFKLVSESGSPILDAQNLLLLSTEHSPPVLGQREGPYARMVWKPAFNFLSNESATTMYPLFTLDDTAVIPSVIHLALLLLVQFHKKYLEIDSIHSEVPHMQQYLKWVRRTIDLAREDRYPHGKEVLGYSMTKREEEIEVLFSSLNKVSSEARLMCRIYENLPDIVTGKKSGIQVALQDNLLIELYGDGHGTREGNRRLAAMVDLLSHDKPDLQILEIGAGTGSTTQQVLTMLNGDTLYRRYKSYAFTDITTSFLGAAQERLRKYRGITYSVFDMEKPSHTQGLNAIHDLVIASNSIHATSDILATLSNVRSLLQSGGRLILLENTRSLLSTALTLVMGTFSDFWKGDEDKFFPRLDGPFLDKGMWSEVLQHSGFNGLDFFLDDYAGQPAVTVLVATAADPNKLCPSPALTEMEELTIVYRGYMPKFASALTHHARSQGYCIKLVSIDSSDAPNCKRLIFLTELNAPMFNDITATEWKGLQGLLRCASSVLWVTNGGLLNGREPMFAMISGIARGISTEMNHLHLSLLDLDQDIEQSVSETCELLLEFERNVTDKSTERYREYRQRDGIIFTTRLQADRLLNERSKAEAEYTGSFELTRLDKLKHTPLQLQIEKPGIMSTVYFREDTELSQSLRDDCIEIEVKAIGVNNKDIAVLCGKYHSNSTSAECAGIISRIGKSVTNFAIGDRVMCLSFAKYGNYVREKAALCQKFDRDTRFEDMATMPLAFCTAIHGLMGLAKLKRGESVLIQSATGGVGFAAIQIAKLCGAEIYVTVGNPEKKQKLLCEGFGIEEDHVFWSREKSTPNEIMKRTAGKGIDVILSNSQNEMLHEYWRCIATFGRFIDIGRMEVMNHGNLSMNVLRRHATFMSFDLSIISVERPEIIESLMETVKDFHQRSMISPIPHKCFHVSEIESALAFWTQDTRTGKVVVTYEHTNAGIKFRKSPYNSRFDPDATYLLVGCLGGLGQLCSRWMVDRGARNLTYLSRSGDSKEGIRGFITELQQRNVETHIVKGDVTNLNDVRRAVACSGKPVRGVIQAALTLQDRLFENLTVDMFHATVKPRVTGTMNLHLALEHSPLDFFMMWTSWTNMFGTATQSNYLASCSFMDAFARFRRNLGLCASSLSLNQILDVGAVSGMPGYETAMARNGLYGNDESDFLQYCDAAIGCSAGVNPNWPHDPLTESHLLAGIEPAGLLELDKEYPLKEMEWYNDSRFSNLVQATQILSSTETSSNTGDNVGDNAGEDLGAVDRIHKRLAQLLFVPTKDIIVTRPVNDYGIDSMIAAELKNWLFKTFAADISLFNLLDPTMTVKRLATEVAGDS